jgi:2-dehydropantoate 2-reductase
MRVAILGAGAMGAIFGTALHRAGAEVAFFDKRSDVVEAIVRQGLVLDGVFPTVATRFPATTIPAELGKVDWALVLVDSNATADVAEVAAFCLKDNGCALTLQNGIGNWETLANRLGGGRVLAGSTYNSGAGLGPGRARHTNLGPTVMGETNGARSERAQEIGRLLESAGLPVEISDNVQGHIWSKFVHNCAINPISAVTRLRPGEIARTKAAARLLDGILDEASPWWRPPASAYRNRTPARIFGITAGSATIARPCYSISRAAEARRLTRSTAPWSGSREISACPRPSTRPSRSW